MYFKRAVQWFITRVRLEEIHLSQRLVQPTRSNKTLKSKEYVVTHFLRISHLLSLLPWWSFACTQKHQRASLGETNSCKAGLSKQFTFSAAPWSAPWGSGYRGNIAQWYLEHRMAYELAIKKTKALHRYVKHTAKGSTFLQMQIINTAPWMFSSSLQFPH